MKNYAINEDGITRIVVFLEDRIKYALLTKEYDKITPKAIEELIRDNVKEVVI